MKVKKNITFSFVLIILTIQFGCDDQKRKEILLFTGSSSIERWTTLRKDFSNYQVVNSGVSGTTMEYIENDIGGMILNYSFDKVFVYSGDNDLEEGYSPEEIIITASNIVDTIFAVKDSVEIIFISAKPSPARWALRDSYEAYNLELKSFTEGDDRIFFMNIWDLMLNVEGKPNGELFVEDSLHMNAKGYEIWTKAAYEFLQ